MEWQFQKILQKNPKRMKKMYENVKSETITISREEYDTLKRERDEYRSVALDLGVSTEDLNYQQMNSM